ncbi:uncharacterized protein LOC108953326 isoform X2 [Musa acuminata AAA Group]|uniref:uncharacterized protein LOC135642657 n=1 Tax=Musa acuminata AAA Group TaxID=214697 RepID=UPI0031DDAAE6
MRRIGNGSWKRCKLMKEDVLELQGIESPDVVGCNCKCHPVSYSHWCIDFLQHLFNPKEMLDELGEHVESIDMTNDLHLIGGLVPLLGYLKTSDAGIGAKDADVVTTIVQNNPRSRQLVMEPLLSNFTSHPDLTVHTEALGVISSLIQNNQAGIAAFDLVNGYAVLGDALCSERVMEGA